MAERGIYVQMLDHSLMNWIIGAEGTAVSIVATAQAWKKKSNNNYQYLEALLDKWADRYGIEYIAQIAQTFLSTNINN